MVIHYRSFRNKSFLETKYLFFNYILVLIIFMVKHISESRYFLNSCLSYNRIRIDHIFYTRYYELIYYQASYLYELFFFSINLDNRIICVLKLIKHVPHKVKYLLIILIKYLDYNIPVSYNNHYYFINDRNISQYILNLTIN